MKLNPTAIPQGTRTYVFEEAAHKRFLEQAIHSVLRGRGYQEIVTPPFEYYESMVSGLTQEERNRLIRFTEGDSGRIIALRADITSQVARSAATHLSERPLPMRLCYTGAVFRRTRTGKGEQYVLNQCGMEIIGHAGPEAEIELALAIVSALETVRLKDCSLSLGHAGFIASFLDGLDSGHAEAARRALRKKDRTGLEAVIRDAGMDATEGKRMLALTGLYGGEEVLEKAENLCERKEEREALENLKTVFASLSGAGLGGKLAIDLGEMRGFGYYTGVIMELFSASGTQIGSGGRYDNLVKRFGPDLPAVGFAFDIDMMMESVRKESGLPEWIAADVLLLGSDEKTAAMLRGSGLMVLVPLDRTESGDMESFAKKMNIPEILSRTEDGSYTWHRLATGEKISVTPGDFLDRYFGK